MAYRLRVYADWEWVGDGTGSATLGANQGNNPGPGPVGMAQTKRYMQMEPVAGGDSPTGANLSTALTNAATDLYAQITAADLAQIQGWSTGGA